MISAMPTHVPLRLAPRQAVDALPFDDRPRLQTYSGRVAILQGLKALGLGRGSVVLVPAYACGSEIDAVLKAGCEVVFYPVTQTLEPDLEACERAVQANPSINALFFTHYLGFAQPVGALRQFADAHDLVLIEDCAHGLLSCDETGQPLGRTGDIAIFSYMKTLPLTDGGACVINRDGVAFDPGTLRPPKITKLLGRFLYQIELSLKGSAPRAAGVFHVVVRGPVRLLKAVLKGGRGQRRAAAPAEPAVQQAAPDNSEEMEVLALDPARRDWALSVLARGTLARLDLETMPKIRRRNYERLLPRIKQIEGLRPLFDRWPPGVCPMAFPVVIEACPAAEFQRHLAAAGLSTKYFWSYFHDIFPRDDFPFETRLKTSVLALPIHQDLSEADMDEVADIVARVMAEQRSA